MSSWQERLKPLLVVFSVGVAVVAIGLGFLFGMDNPISWVLVAAVIALLIFLNWRAKKDFFVWDSKYLIGIPSIDVQHQQLLSLLNDFQRAYAYNAGEKFERHCFDALVEYTRLHFSFEEELLAKNRYPELDAHKLEHRAFVAKVEEYSSRYQQEHSYETMREVADFLKQWLLHHINGTDRAYSGYLQAKGVK
ncbi:MAG: hemerythrin family protein [Gammaproteobacteria bacterium]|nr:hemerythrin family protein [Gammaproteobacteria bacterium]